MCFVVVLFLLYLNLILWRRESKNINYYYRWKKPKIQLFCFILFWREFVIQALPIMIGISKYSLLLMTIRTIIKRLKQQQNKQRKKKRNFSSDNLTSSLYIKIDPNYRFIYIYCICVLHEYMWVWNQWP